MRRFVCSTALLATATALLAIAGCPAPAPPGPEAMIAVSSTRGEAPLRVNVSGAASTSPNGEITAYAWDFAGQATADTVDAMHLFENPGRYTIRLTVTDETGETATSSVDIRAAGQTAPTAVISADVTAGAAPLNVRFDGTLSSAPDDSIVDYFWDFDDGNTSRLSMPFHSFSRAGVYEVELRVVTGGGLEGTTTQRIEVGGGGASLQFDASQRITLPVAAAVSLNQFTFEGWYKADNGGEVVSMGGAFRLEIAPDDDVIRVTVNGSTQQASVALNTGVWEHVAIVYDIANGAEIFIGGQSFGTLTFDQSITTETLIAGRGWRGKLAELRTWMTARTQAEINATIDTRLTGAETGLFSNWPLNEGAGQLLANRALGGLTGALGSATAEEAADPAWSTDGPPLR